MEKKEILKEIIKRLHQGERPEDLIKEFQKEIETITPAEIARIEQELIEEGMKPEEIRRFCDVHLAVFRESLKRPGISPPEWHPIAILLKEHECIISLVRDLDPEKLSRLKETEKHYLREENVLFPYLEKHGIVQPPKIMWAEHDEIRRREKEKDFRALPDLLMSHFYKENNILFPTALDVITDEEWYEVREEFDGIGYFAFNPPPPPPAKIGPGTKPVGMIDLPTGGFSKEELEAILNTLPIDITFVDKDDTVRYFSQSKDRIFVRSRAIIGRKVQNCHPQKSVHLVNRILEDFRNKKRSVAEFWLNLGGKLVYIRYFPLYDKDGGYLGCIEVTQDITRIKQIEGEKRLLD
ncbi:DUF438 domain-containing protein [candidate division WOR-3 bacterium]|uniref:DUF438 domain-containing protein n=1 Tax=candidate division WOR-3 bacterium TaxID=2052148 RepID=A0A660SJ94_UNCW3|nr:MAG: DUF438 domain-containing protein [candidate division WOR-3 bacterium]